MTLGDSFAEPPMNRILFAAAAAGALALASAAQAQGALAVGGQIGTPGAGATVQYAISPSLVVRGSYDVLRYDHGFSSDDIDYGGGLDWEQAGAFIDLHPWNNGFTVSGGAYFGSRDTELRATPNHPVRIGGTTFTAAEAGTLSGEIDFGSTSPFAGIGFDNTFSGSGPIGFRAMFGAQLNADPSVTLRRTGGAALTPTVQAQLDAELRNEERRLQSEAEDFRLYPVLQVGLTYRF